jgi:hypothetical protein
MYHDCGTKQCGPQMAEFKVASAFPISRIAAAILPPDVWVPVLRSSANAPHRAQYTSPDAPFSCLASHTRC